MYLPGSLVMIVRLLLNWLLAVPVILSDGRDRWVEIKNESTCLHLKPIEAGRNALCLRFFVVFRLWAKSRLSERASVDGGVPATSAVR